MIILVNSAPAAGLATWALFAEMADFAKLTILRNAIFAKRVKSGAVCLHRALGRKNLMKGRW